MANFFEKIGQTYEKVNNLNPLTEPAKKAWDFYKEVNQDWGPGGYLFKRPVDNLNRKEEEAKGLTQQEIEEQQTRAKQARADAERRQKLLGEAKARIQTKEAQLADVLKQRRADVETAIEAQLDKLLTEAGFAAGEARRDVGEIMSDRGLSRSSFASQGIENVTLAEQEEKANQRLAAATAKRQIAEGTEGAMENIRRRRELAEQAESMEELSFLQGQAGMWDETSLRNQFSNELDNIQLDAESKRFYTTLVGQSIGNIAGILTSLIGRG